MVICSIEIEKHGSSIMWLESAVNVVWVHGIFSDFINLYVAYILSMFVCTKIKTECIL